MKSKWSASYLCLVAVKDDKKFGTESRLNEKFNNFVEVCQKAYEGINTIQDQLADVDRDECKCTNRTVCVGV